MMCKIIMKGEINSFLNSMSPETFTLQNGSIKPQVTLTLSAEQFKIEYMQQVQTQSTISNSFEANPQVVDRKQQRHRPTEMESKRDTLTHTHTKQEQDFASTSLYI